MRVRGEELPRNYQPEAVKASGAGTGRAGGKYPFFNKRPAGD